MGAQAGANGRSAAGQSGSTATLAQKEGVNDKVSENQRLAILSFAAGDYASAMRSLEQIPQPMRTPEIRELLKKCQHLKTAQLHWESAQRSMSHGDYDQAVRTVERIPAEARTLEMQHLLDTARQQAKLKPTINAAKRSLMHFDYDAAVRVLEDIPAPVRTPELISLLDEANKKRQLVIELQSQIDQQLAEAASEQVADLYAALVPRLEELLALQPNHAGTRRQLDEVRRCQDRLAHRDRLYHAAQTRFDNKDYQGCLVLLEQIPDDLRGELQIALKDEAQANQQEVERLAADLLVIFRQTRIEELAYNFDRLTELQPSAVATVMQRVGDHDFELFLTALAKTCAEREENIRLLDGLLDLWHIDRLASFLEWRGTEFLQSYPAGGTVLGNKLGQMLSKLHEHGARVPTKLQIFQAAQQHIGEHAERLQQWEDLLTQLELLGKMLGLPWRLQDAFIQTWKNSRLEKYARTVAQAAAQVLPPGRERWGLLDLISGGKMQHNSLVVRKVFRKMQRFLADGRWPNRPITYITHRRLAHLSGGASGLLMLGAIGILIRSYLFKLGSYTGLSLTVSLAVLWFGFYLGMQWILSTKQSDDGDELPING